MAPSGNGTRVASTPAAGRSSGGLLVVAATLGPAAVLAGLATDAWRPPALTAAGAAA